MPQTMEDYYKMATAMYAPYLESLQQMYAGLGGSAQPQTGYAYPGQHPHHHHHHGWHERDCGCDRCDECDECGKSCTCCIGDADLVVYARLGERRVVPITIDNCNRREREVRLELSRFTRRGGGQETGLQGTLSTEGFTLRGCDEQTVTITIDLGGGEQGGGEQGGGDVAGATERRTRLGLDECIVLYADLRIEGCDVRPVRIALAVMPRDCEAYEVSCDCSCCC